MTGEGPWPRDRRERELLDPAEGEEGAAFLMLREPGGRLSVRRLERGSAPVVVGRRETSDLALPWDDQVSRVHCAVERVGDEWAVSDEGLSRNGTFVNGERTHGRRRLRDGDVLRVGRTLIGFRSLGATAAEPTSGPAEWPRAPSLTNTQRMILLALARPLAPSGTLAAPATNNRIAAEVHLSVSAVKAHLRVLFRKFGIEDLPQNEKRTRLAALALGTGLVRAGELRDPPDPA